MVSRNSAYDLNAELTPHNPILSMKAMFLTSVTPVALQYTTRALGSDLKVNHRKASCYLGAQRPGPNERKTREKGKTQQSERNKTEVTAHNSHNSPCSDSWIRVFTDDCGQCLPHLEDII